MIKEVVGIRFPKDSRINYCDSTEFFVKIGEMCLVEMEGYCDIGLCVKEAAVLKDYEMKKYIPKIIGKAQEEDLKKQEANKKKEDFSKKLFMEKVEAYNLNMKLKDVHLSVDGKKYTFYFSSSERIDFRELVKELAHELSAKIELYQIGAREEAKLYGGFSWCGRELCCSKFLKELEIANLRMVKEQNLSLFFSKTKGVCGKLMCCLAFEDSLYKEFRKKAPKEGSTYKTDEGIGIVEVVDPILSCIKVRLEDKRLIEVMIKF